MQQHVLRQAVSYLFRISGESLLPPVEGQDEGRCCRRFSLNPTLPMNLRPKVALQPFPLPSGEGGPKGRVREETDRLMGAIRDNEVSPGGLSRREREKRNVDTLFAVNQFTQFKFKR